MKPDAPASETPVPSPGQPAPHTGQLPDGVFALEDGAPQAPLQVQHRGPPKDQAAP